MFKELIIFICLCQFIAILTAERVAVQFPEEATAAIVGIMKTCIKKTGVQNDAIEVIKTGEIVDEPKFKEFFYCTSIDAGFGYPDGHVNVEFCTALFPKDLQPTIGPVLELCNKEEGVDKYDTVFKFLKCFQEKSPVRVALA